MMKQFFGESKEQSQIKSRIVSKYFWAWARIIRTAVRNSGDPRILYLDLFAGPGRYEDGTRSTPLLILEKAIEDPDARQMLVTIFNDSDPENTGSLAGEIQKLPGLERLKYKPRIWTREVGPEIEKEFADVRLIPTFSFVDPWGYKGLSLGLIEAVLKDWGSDCVFFFNYNRINMGLGNEIVREHMDALFGTNRANRLRRILPTLEAAGREATVLENLVEALSEKGAKFVLPFTFRTASGERTSHHLIFATKHFRGYEVMKEIMAGESSEQAQGVASFEYLPAFVEQPVLFELTRPLEELAAMLLEAFAGKTFTTQQVYEQHSVGRRFIKRNYKQALAQLEAEARIKTSPPAAKRPKRSGQPTFVETVVVTFPRKKRGI